MRLLLENGAGDGDGSTSLDVRTQTAVVIYVAKEGLERVLSCYSCTSTHLSSLLVQKFKIEDCHCENRYSDYITHLTVTYPNNVNLYTCIYVSLTLIKYYID